VKAYTGSRDITPLILTFGARWRRVQHHAPDSLLQGKAPVSIAWEVLWAPEPVWKIWRTEKSLAATGIRIPDYPTPSLGTVMSRLFGLGYYVNTYMYISCGYRTSLYRYQMFSPIL
jgi:hypothetical protein